MTAGILARLRGEREFRMAWRIEKGGHRGYLCGTAHFFPYSFRRSFSGLVGDVDAVLLEGPLDDADMSQVRRRGEEGSAADSLYAALTPGAIKRIDSETRKGMATRGDTFSSYMEALDRGAGGAVRREIEGVRPWLAFFKVWSLFLRNRGWTRSVDLEILGMAREMGKTIQHLETIDEQIAAMDGIPFERIANFLNSIDQWDGFARRHLRSYLDGDIEGLMGVTADFPTRCPSIVEDRDPVIFQRAIPFFERGRAMLCVGTIHLRGISQFFGGEGYEVVQCGP